MGYTDRLSFNKTRTAQKTILACIFCRKNLEDRVNTATGMVTRATSNPVFLPVYCGLRHEIPTQATKSPRKMQFLFILA
jgi:hypothetical protein